jgi:hypothetical protein
MQAQPRAANNARSSRVPNLNYTAISPAQLRRQPRFIALPPADALIVSSKQPATFRYRWELPVCAAVPVWGRAGSATRRHCMGVDPVCPARLAGS